MVDKIWVTGVKETALRFTSLVVEEESLVCRDQVALKEVVEDEEVEEEEAGRLTAAVTKRL